MYCGGCVLASKEMAYFKECEDSGEKVLCPMMKFMENVVRILDQ